MLLNTVFVGFGRTLGNETAAATAATMAASQRRMASTKYRIAVVLDRCGERCEMRTAAIAINAWRTGRRERRCTQLLALLQLKGLTKQLRRPALWFRRLPFAA